MNRKKLLIAIVAVLLVLGIGFGIYAYKADTEEYNAAIRFFHDYNLSTEGLNRGQIKAVYADITTKSFSDFKTAEVIQNSLIDGYEIWQDDPSQEDIENLWEHKKDSIGTVGYQSSGIHYEYSAEYKRSDLLDREVHDKSYIKKYDGDTQLWSVEVTEFNIDGFRIVSDGVIIYGKNEVLISVQEKYAWMMKIDAAGNKVWRARLYNGFTSEYIAGIVENPDGTYAVFSRGDYEYLCLSQYSADGKELLFKKTDMGNHGILNAVRFGDGYMVQLVDYADNNRAKLARLDHEGNITGSFSYEHEDSRYYITDMMEFNGKIYLSTYAVPKVEGTTNEWASVVDRMREIGHYEISSEELTPLLRENYTAVLLVCDPDLGVPQEFYSIEGSLGGRLFCSSSGELLWDVESIARANHYPSINAFSFAGASYVFRYTFDNTGTLISQWKTGETVEFVR